MYRFNAYGHKNVLSAHETTLEFTKDDYLTKNGDCIIGVKADFSLEEIKQFIKNLDNKKIKITITIDNEKETVKAEINPDFNSDHEMVIRKSDFLDKRTFAINADKAAVDLKESLKSMLTKPVKTKIIVEKQ